MSLPGMFNTVEEARPPKPKAIRRKGRTFEIDVVVDGAEYSVERSTVPTPADMVKIRDAIREMERERLPKPPKRVLRAGSPGGKALDTPEKVARHMVPRLDLPDMDWKALFDTSMGGEQATRLARKYQVPTSLVRSIASNELRERVKSVASRAGRVVGGPVTGVTAPLAVDMLYNFTPQDVLAEVATAVDTQRTPLDRIGAALNLGMTLAPGPTFDAATAPLKAGVKAVARRLPKRKPPAPLPPTPATDAAPLADDIARNFDKIAQNQLSDIARGKLADDAASLVDDAAKEALMQTPLSQIAENSMKQALARIPDEELARMPLSQIVQIVDEELARMPLSQMVEDIARPIRRPVSAASVADEAVQLVDDVALPVRPPAPRGRRASVPPTPADDAASAAEQAVQLVDDVALPVRPPVPRRRRAPTPPAPATDTASVADEVAQVVDEALAVRPPAPRGRRASVPPAPTTDAASLADDLMKQALARIPDEELARMTLSQIVDNIARSIRPSTSATKAVSVADEAVQLVDDVALPVRPPAPRGRRASVPPAPTDDVASAADKAARVVDEALAARPVPKSRKAPVLPTAASDAASVTNKAAQVADAAQPVASRRKVPTPLATVDKASGGKKPPQFTLPNNARVPDDWLQLSQSGVKAELARYGVNVQLPKLVRESQESVIERASNNVKRLREVLRGDLELNPRLDRDTQAVAFLMMERRGRQAMRLLDKIANSEGARKAAYEQLYDAVLSDLGRLGKAVYTSRRNIARDLAFGNVYLPLDAFDVKAMTIAYQRAGGQLTPKAVKKLTTLAKVGKQRKERIARQISDGAEEATKRVRSTPAKRDIKDDLVKVGVKAVDDGGRELKKFISLVKKRLPGVPDDVISSIYGRALKEHADLQRPIHDVLREIALMMKQANQSTNAEMVEAIARANALSGFRTLQASLGGNLVQGMIEEAVQLPAAIVGAASRIGRARLAGRLRGMVEGAKASMSRNTLRKMKESTLHGATSEELIRADFHGMLNWKPDSAIGRVVNTYVNTVSGLLGAVDRPAREYWMVRSLYEQAYERAAKMGLRGKELREAAEELVARAGASESIAAAASMVQDEVLAEMLKKAKMWREEMVFANPNVIADAVTAAKHSAKAAGKDWALLPANLLQIVVRVPTNVAGRMVEYSGLGLPLAIVKAASDPARAAIMAQRGALGPALLALGYWLRERGMVTPPFSLSQAGRAQSATLGEQPNSVTFNAPDGRRVQISVSDYPGLVGLTLGAMLYDNVARAKDEGSASVTTGAVAEALTQGVMGSMASIPSMQAARQAAMALTRIGESDSALTELGETAAKTYAGLVVPQFVTDGATLADPVARETRTAQDRIVADLPEARKRLPIKVDPLGRETPPSPISSVVRGVRVANDMRDSIAQELYRLGVAPPEVKYSREKDKNVTDWVKRAKAIGEERRKRLSTLFSSSVYLYSSDEDKRKFVKQALRAASVAAQDKD